MEKTRHAYASLLEVLQISHRQFNPAVFQKLLKEFIQTKEWMTKGITTSREKDYSNPFRKMVYDNSEEMDSVLGKMQDNSFIIEKGKALLQLKSQVKKISRKLS